MPKKTQIAIVALEMDKVLRLHQTIESESARRILRELTTQPMTEHELVKKLALSVPTVKRTLSVLLDSEIIVAGEHSSHHAHTFSITNKPVVVVPLSKRSTLDRLKRIAPILVITSVVAGIIQIVNKEGAQSVLRALSISTDGSAVSLAANTPSGKLSFQIAPWFLVGAIFAIVLFIAYDYWKEGLGVRILRK